MTKISFKNKFVLLFLAVLVGIGVYFTPYIQAQVNPAKYSVSHIGNFKPPIFLTGITSGETKVKYTDQNGTDGVYKAYLSVTDKASAPRFDGLLRVNGVSETLPTPLINSNITGDFYNKLYDVTDIVNQYGAAEYSIMTSATTQLDSYQSMNMTLIILEEDVKDAKKSYVSLDFNKVISDTSPTTTSVSNYSFLPANGNLEVFGSFGSLNAASESADYKVIYNGATVSSGAFPGGVSTPGASGYSNCEGIYCGDGFDPIALNANSGPWSATLDTTSLGTATSLRVETNLYRQVTTLWENLQGVYFEASNVNDLKVAYNLPNSATKLMPPNTMEIVYEIDGTNVDGLNKVTLQDLFDDKVYAGATIGTPTISTGTIVSGNIKSGLVLEIPGGTKAFVTVPVTIPGTVDVVKGFIENKATLETSENTTMSTPAYDIFYVAELNYDPNYFTVNEQVSLGDTSVTGTGVPGYAIEIKDSKGAVVGTQVVAADKTWSVTTSPLQRGDYYVTQSDSDQTSTPKSFSILDLKIDPMAYTDNTITGHGTAGNDVVVKNASGQEVATVKIDASGNFTLANLPTNTTKLNFVEVNPNGVTSKEVNMYYVVHDLGGGVATTINPIFVEENTSAPVPVTPTREGYVFDAWRLTASSTGTVFDYATQKITSEQTVYATWTAQDYTLSFNTNGANSPAIADQTVAYGELAQKPTDPTKTGQVFGGWYSDSGLTNAWNFAVNTMPASDQVLYAKWTVADYKLSFETNGADSGVIPVQTVPFGTLASKPADPTKVGYTFAGWYKESSLTNTWDFSTDTMPANDQVLYAKWSAQTYQVTYDLNGATSTPINPVSVEFGAVVPTPINPTWSGHTFEKWTTDAEGNSAWNFATPMPANDLVLYAQWTLDQLVVNPVDPSTGCITGTGYPGNTVEIKDPNGQVIGTATIGPDGTYSVCDLTSEPNDITVSQTTPDGVDESLPVSLLKVTYDPTITASPVPATVYAKIYSQLTEPVVPTSPGYTFAGWYTESGTLWNYQSDVLYNSMTLYGKWKLDAPVVSPMNPEDTCLKGTAAPGSTVVVTASDGTTHEVVVAADGTWSYCDSLVPGDVTIEVTDPNGNTSTPVVLYVVDFDTHGAADPQPNNIAVASGEAIKAPVTPVKDGYTFVNWNTSADGTGTAWDFSTPVTSSMTLHAVWEAKGNTVTFDQNYAGAPASVQATVKTGELVVEPTAPVRVGYDFGGWYTDTNLATAWNFSIDLMPANDIVLYAKWTATEYSLSFETNGADSGAIAAQNISFGELAKEPAKPTKLGYTFAGWYKESSLTNAWDFSTDTMPANDQVLYAKWSAQAYQVTYDLNGATSTPINPVSVEFGAVVPTPINPTWSGHTFEKWTTDAEGNSAWNFATPMPANDLVLYAQWTLDQLVVNPMDPSTGCITGTGYPGNTVEIKDPNGQVIGTATIGPDGTYSVCDLTSEPNDITVSQTTPDGVDESLPVSLLKVTYDPTIAASPVPATVYAKVYSQLTEPVVPTSPGYTFVGWYTESGTLWNYQTDVLYNSMTLYGKWELDAPVVSPMNPEDTCLKGTAAPGSTVVVTDSDGTTHEVVVGADGTWSYCDPLVPGDVTIEVTDPNGNTSTPVVLYVVDFDTHGAVDPQPNNIAVASGEVIKAPVTPVKDGYTFVNWNTSADGTGTAWDFSKPVTSSMTLHAVWEAKGNTVTFDQNYAGAPAAVQLNVKTGELITEPAVPVRDGYTFGGWSQSSTDSTLVWDFTTPMPANDVTLYAVWSANEYVVTFDTNGASSPAIPSQTVKTGELITEPAEPVKEGYTFVGWSLMANRSDTKWDFANDPMKPNDITLIAVWGVEPYQVSFDLNGGEGNAPSTQIVDFGQLITEPSEPVKMGHTFIGWSTDPSDASMIWDFTTPMPANDLVLYAMWEVDTYKLTFLMNDGTTTVFNSQDVLYARIPVNPGIPVRTGYSFIEWNVLANGSGSAYDVTWPYNQTQDLTVYANWRPNQPTVDPIQPGDVCMTGTGNPGDKVVVKDGAGNVVGEVIISADGTYTLCPDTIPNGDLNVVAVDPNGNESAEQIIDGFESVYSVTFDMNGATSTQVQPQSLPSNSKVTKPTDPSKAGYEFVGWINTATNSVWNFDTDTVANSNIVLVASWKQVEDLVDPVGPSGLTVDPVGPSDNTVTGTGTPGTIIEVIDSNGNVIGSTVVKPDGTYEVQIDSSSVKPGDKLIVRATDELGNVIAEVEIVVKGEVLAETGTNEASFMMIGLSMMFVAVANMLIYRRIK